MQSKQAKKRSREEIIKYVDDLIKANKIYDKSFHECLHATDLYTNEDNLVKFV